MCLCHALTQHHAFAIWCSLLSEPSHAYGYMDMHIYIYIYTYVCVCVYIYIKISIAVLLRVSHGTDMAALL